MLKSKGNLHTYITKLQESIRELRTCYDNLLLRFEEFIITEFIGEHVEFEEYKLKLQKRYKKLKKHLCLPYQKAFIQRLDSELDDKKAWLSSIAQVIVGKSLEVIKDDEEIILYDKFKTMILELDSLTSISKSDLDDENEEILGIELSSFVNGIQKKIVRLPKSKRDEVIKMENSIKQMLSRDKSLNIAAITNILKDLLNR